MIIFKKLPNGTWEKSGEVLPTEQFYRIAPDAQDPEKVPLPCADAIAEVERRIAAGTQAYRFELASPPASFHKAARERAEKGIKKILDSKAKAVRKSKPAKKAKKESGAQRRARLKREGKCTACGKRQPRKGRTECGVCAKYYRDWAKKAGK
jgi:hypothetical protein